MRSALIRPAFGTLAASSVLAVALVAAESVTTTTHTTALDAYGVLCEQASGELARTRDSSHAREVTYTGVVLSEDDRVSGTLTVELTLTPERNGRRGSYRGHIAVHPTALDGKGGWEGSLRGELQGSKAWEDPSALALEIVHRRTVLRGNRAGPGRTARPSDARVVRRSLRGTGTLDGLRLVFDHRVNEGERPAATALPAGCMADYELWSGVVADIRR